MDQKRSGAVACDSARGTRGHRAFRKEGESVFAMGLGLIRNGGDYFNENKAIYICGEIEGVYGFFRSVDDGKTWVKINNETQCFGDINSIDGDCRIYGRFYIATGSFGLKYGEMVEEL